MNAQLATIGATTLKPAEWTRVRSDRPARWPLCALVIGAAELAEFAPIVAELREWTDAVLVADVQTALRIVREDDCSPDCLVLLENRPGELSREGIDELRAAVPLSRAVCVLGSWCEGEYRSGQPWPAVVRVYWHQFRGWIRQELAAIEHGDCSALCLPITATEEERLLQNVAATSDELATASTPQYVVIHSNRREMQDLLAEICENIGFSFLPLPPGEGRGEGRSETDSTSQTAQKRITIAIWDLATVEPKEISEFTAAAARLPQARWIVLAGFVREETRAALMRHGASEVLSKPLVIDQLRATLLAPSSEHKSGQRLLFF